MRNRPVIYLLAVVLAALLSACAQITTSRPVFGYATVNMRPNSNDTPAVQIIEVKSTDGSATASFPGNQPYIKHLYLRTGEYELKVDCRRNWPNPPADSSTYRLPYGLGTDDSSERITVSVQAGKIYFLDCDPGLNKSEFIFREDVWLAIRMPAPVSGTAPPAPDSGTAPPHPDPSTAPPPP